MPRLERSQFVPRPIEEVFAFFSDAKNLQELTPASLSFRIDNPEPVIMQTGVLIDYRIKLFGAPMKWRTLIESFEPPHRFVDVQLTGPYKAWRHLHEFQSVENGTLMRDVVEYELPLGILGGLAHVLFVQRTLSKIFDYREQQMAKLFAPVTVR